MILGIMSGLATAFFQDLGYIFSRRYVKLTNDPLLLLAGSQVLLGVFSLFVLPFLLFSEFPRGFDFIIPVFFVSSGSLGGQYFFFRAERCISSERISSLMGLRIVLLAFAMSLFYGVDYHLLQWFGVVLPRFRRFF